MQVLTGHTSEATAYVVDDYPYGFRLRTQIRYWIETKKGHGQRFVSQTLNPKNGKWNKPKAGTYDECVLLTINDDTGHVEPVGLYFHANLEQIAAFEAIAPDDNRTREVIRYMRAARRAESKVTWSIHECGPDCTEHHQTIKEQGQMLNELTRRELWAESLDAIRTA